MRNTNKKDWAIYKKNVAKYRKILTKKAKNAFPFDYGFGLDMFIQFLTFMQEYYKDDINVVAMEAEEVESRLQSITRALDEYNLYKEFSEGIPAATDVISEDGSIKTLWVNWSIEMMEENHERMMEHWNNFWNIVRDNMLTWWD